MKKLFVILLIGFSTIALSAQNDKSAKIEFETTVIDYGTIEKKGLMAFAFSNLKILEMLLL